MKVRPIEEVLTTYLYALEKNAARESFVDFLENWSISDQEQQEIKKWYFDRGITGYITR